MTTSSTFCAYHKSSNGCRYLVDGICADCCSNCTCSVQFYSPYKVVILDFSELNTMTFFVHFSCHVNFIVLIHTFLLSSYSKPPVLQKFQKK